jgi:hypothetical protein
MHATRVAHAPVRFSKEPALALRRGLWSTGAAGVAPVGRAGVMVRTVPGLRAIRPRGWRVTIIWGGRTGDSGGAGARRHPGLAAVRRAQILLAAAAGVVEAEIAATVHLGTATVYRTKQRFVEQGLERALAEAPRPGAAGS